MYEGDAIKLLEGDKEISEKYPVDLPQVLDRSYETEIINQKYEFIEEIVQEVLVNKEEKAQSTDKADRILTHPIFGIPIFLGIMALVFLLTFTVGDFISGYFELAVEWLSGFISNCLAAWQVNPAVTSLLVDGIIAGVGGILTFLPNIFILFLALAFLEDSRIHGKSGLCYGRHYGADWVIRPCLYSDDSRIWVFGAGSHGVKGIRR